MKTCLINKCRSVIFIDEPDLRLIWFDDQERLGTCRVECFWRNFPIWDHSYPRQDTFDETVKKYTRRAKKISLILYERNFKNERYR